MRMTAVFLLVAGLHASAAIRAQKITLTVRQAPLRTVFKEISRQTGLSIMYEEDMLLQSSPVSLSVKDASLEETLQACLKDQPFMYSLVNGAIVIRSKETAPVLPAGDTAVLPHAPAKIDVHGTVYNEAGQPFAGANVTVKGTGKGTITGEKGEFELKRIDENATLVFSSVGIETVEMKVRGKTNLIVRTKQAVNSLDATIVQAYGTTSRRFSVGSIASVNAETIEKQPVTNVLLALEGQAPGLTVNATSGVPGSRVLVQIRGENSLASTYSGFKPYDQPLFIIDGVPFAPQNNNINQLSSLANVQSFSGGISQAGGFSPFNNINPNDIESISILKDADATSIYGTQGSNGVILITTKKGKPGKTVFNLNVNSGFNSDARSVKLMNTQQYIQLRKDAFAADGIVPSNNPSNSGYTPELTIFDQNKYTDWQKVIFGKTSSNTDIHGSVSGGSYNNTFILSGGYTRSNYNYPGNYAEQRWTLHSAVHHSSTDNRFSIDFGTDYAYDQNNSPGFGGSQDIFLPPNTPDLLNARGNLIWNYQGIDLSSYQFYAYLKRPTGLQNYNLNNTLRIAYKIIDGLTVSANLGYSRNTTSEQSQSPASAQSPLYINRTANFANSAFQTLNIEPLVDYTRRVGKGMFSALLGGTYKKNTSSSNTIQGSGYANDNFLGSIVGAATLTASDNTGIYKYSAGFARVKYIYDQKYIVSLTGRRDGSSNFGPGRQFGNFGSAGAAWIFSEEKGFKSVLPFISYAKLSGNYGTSGSDGIQAYQYQAFWKPYLTPFQGVQPNAPVNLYNPDYSWALKKSLNLALDFGFFNNKLLLNTTWYRDRESNQLAGYPLPIHTGFSNVLENLNATVQNQGWEFTLTSNNIKTKNFTWSTNFNISFNRNKLISFPNLASSSYSSKYVIGQPTSIIIGYKYKDVNPATGLFEFYTKNGGDTSKPSSLSAAQGGDYVPIANREVNYMGGLGNTMTYKHFSVYVFFQFSSQMAPNYLYTMYNSYSPGRTIYNQPVQLLNNYWKEQGDHVALQRLMTGYSSIAAVPASDFTYSSGVYSNDTYLRLKTIALSYSLPNSLIRRLHIQDGSVYVNAQNLLTITNYKVGDPEQFSYNSFPMQRIIAFGVSLHL